MLRHICKVPAKNETQLSTFENEISCNDVPEIAAVQYFENEISWNESGLPYYHSNTVVAICALLVCCAACVSLFLSFSLCVFLSVSLSSSKKTYDRVKIDTCAVHVYSVCVCFVLFCSGRERNGKQSKATGWNEMWCDIMCVVWENENKTKSERMRKTITIYIYIYIYIYLTNINVPSFMELF